LTGNPTEIVWTTTDQEDFVIELDTETINHIRIERGRNETSDLESRIKETVKTPHMVVQSEKYADTRIYEKYDILEGDYSETWFNVSVSFQGMQGRVTSAYSTLEPKEGTIVKVYYKP